MITTMAAVRWIIYSLLLLLRFYGAYYNSLPGYIHPDEFFQGGQELFFGCQQRLQLDSKTETAALLHDDDEVELLSHREAQEHKYPISHQYVVHNIPWEFEPTNAIRSIVPPAFMTLLPLRVYSVLRSMIMSSGDDSVTVGCPSSSIDNNALVEEQLSGSEILIIPRLFMTLLSVIFLDGCLWILVKNYTTTQHYAKDTTTHNGQHRSSSSSNNMSGPPIEVIVLASSWPMLVMTTRPFTNALEAMVISVLLLIVARDHHRQGSKSNKNYSSKLSNQQCTAKTLLIGTICSIGLFVRFTFAFFALPIVLLFLYNRWWHGDKNRPWRNIGWNMLSLALSFLTTSLVFVTIDWYYYQYHSPGRDTVGTSICNDLSCSRDAFIATVSKYVVPWNAFRYNSKATNLAEHGLHPRITHMLVNMPMMFGPLSLVGYYSCIKMRKVYASSSFAETCFGRVLCQSTIISGLLVLSCAPHQEPRFLLPCIVPVVFLYGRNVVGMETTHSKPKKRVILTAIWVVFNSILYIFFGWLHQGGLTSSLLHLPLPVNPYEGSPETVIYYKTYMPPTFLTRGRSPANIEKGSTCIANYERRRVSVEGHIALACNNQLILDLHGREAEILLDVLHERLPCDQQNEESILLVTSVPVMISLAEKKWSEYKFLSVHGHRTHVSTEDWPLFNGSFKSFFDQMELVTYQITCTVEI